MSGKSACIIRNIRNYYMPGRAGKERDAGKEDVKEKCLTEEISFCIMVSVMVIVCL
jgi:hypothetical protein